MVSSALTPPTPSRRNERLDPSFVASDFSRGLLLPLQGSTPPIIIGSVHVHVTPSGGPELCTPVEVDAHHTPPPELRRESLSVPPSDRMVRMAQGSGVSVYRMERSPRDGQPRSPWVLKKSTVSPLLVCACNRLQSHHSPPTRLRRAMRRMACVAGSTAYFCAGARAAACGAHAGARVMHAGCYVAPKHRWVSRRAAPVRWPPLLGARALRHVAVSAHPGARTASRRLREPHA